MIGYKDKEKIREILRNFPVRGERKTIEEKIEDILWIQRKLGSLKNRIQGLLQPELADFYNQTESFLNTAKELMKREKVKKVEKEKVKALYEWKVNTPMRALEEKLKLLMEINEE